MPKEFGDLQVIPGGRDPLDNLEPSLATTDVAPALRTALVAKPGGQGTVQVRAPGSPTTFPIHTIEWDCARLMDGSRSNAQIAGAMGKRGVPVTPEMVAKLVKE